MKHVPNLLTGLRLLLVPLIWKLLWERHYGLALALGFVASVSDALDGWLARKLDATTKIGAYLDPIADKAMLSGAYLIFGLNHDIPSWLMWIVLGRDVMILLMAASAWAFTSIRDFPPSRWGKLSTLIQILTGLALLLNRSELMIMPQVETFMIWLCAAATVGSGVHYLWLAIHKLREARK